MPHLMTFDDLDTDLLAEMDEYDASIRACLDSGMSWEEIELEDRAYAARAVLVPAGYDADDCAEMY